MVGLLVPNIECAECVDNYGRFVAEPLEKGFGITLGNSLRRVLLGYLPGAAVTQVRIEGVQHEFTVIPNAKEDVTEFLLNVKELRLKPLSDRGGTLVLEVEGEGRVSAADIKPSADFEITNPELCLITLNVPGTKLYIELDVERVVSVNANEIAARVYGSETIPKVGPAMLGAFVKGFGNVQLASVKDAVEVHFPRDTKEHINAVEIAYKEACARTISNIP